MSPPELAADAPVADVLHPVEIDLGEALGDDLDAAVFDRFDGRFGQGLHFDEPLLAGERLDDGLAALAVTDGVGIGFDLVQQPFFFQVRDDLLAAVEAVHALIGPGVLVHGGVGVQDIDQGQVVPLGDLEVHRVVGRGDLDRAGAEGRVDGFVGDDGNRRG